MSVAMRVQDQIGVAEVLRHEGFLRSRVQRWVAKLPHLAMHEDDLMQEGRLGLMWAANHFEEHRGVMFLSFAGKAVDSFMRNFVNRRSHLVRFPQGAPMEMVWLDAPMEHGVRPLADCLPMPEPEVWERDDKHAKLMMAVRRLREVERRVVVECLMRGRIQREVAVEMGCSHTWVQQLLDKAMKSLRRAMGVRIDKDDNTDGWMPLKQWMAEEGEKLNVSGGAIRAQIERGVRRMPETKRVKGRIFVRVAASGEQATDAAQRVPTEEAHAKA